MIKLLSYFFGLFFIIGNFSCQNSTTNQKDIRVIVVDPKEAMDHDTLEKYFEIQQIIPLQTTDKSLISIGINKINVLDSLLYVQDINSNSTLKKFDFSGNFVSEVGRLGNGPGEYMSNNYFFTEKKTHRVNVYDRSSRSIASFDIKNNYLSTKRIPQMYFTSVEMIDDSNYLYYFCNDENFQFFKNKNNYRLVFAENNFHVIDKRLPESVENIRGVAYVNENFCVKTPLGYSISENMNDTVYILKDKKIEPSFIVDFGKYSLPDNYLSTPQEAVNGVVDKLRFAQNKGWAYLNSLVYEDEKYILANYTFMGNRKFFIVDKKKNAIINANVLYSNKYKMIFPPPTYFDGERLVSVMTANNFKELVSYWSKLGKVPESIQKINTGISNEDNPILIFMKLKQD